jgi:predicted esterase
MLDLLDTLSRSNNMINSYMLLLICGFAVFAFCAQYYDTTFKTYQDMRAHLVELYSQDKFNEAAELLLWAREEYPDYLFNNTYNLILMYARMQQYEKGIEALQYALDRGIWFAPYFFDIELWKPLTEQAGFDTIRIQSEAFKREAQMKAKPDLLVVTPDTFNPDKTYPLFIALHGGSENIQIFKDRWRSRKLSEEFITAYPQSSQVIAMNGFWWHENIERTRKEIAEAYQKVVSEYPVDRDNIIIGGFSSGGLAALEIVLSNVVPVAGFIALCPDWPESFSEENVKNAENRGIRGVLITGEQDERRPLHDKMIETFRNAGLSHQYIVIPDIGHDYPDDLDRIIDQAIDQIRPVSIIEQ